MACHAVLNGSRRDGRWVNLLPSRVPARHPGRPNDARGISRGASCMKMANLYRYIGSSMWFVPVMCVLAGAAISFGTIAIDRHFDYQALPSDIVGGPDAAAAILSTVATSMVSLTALVLTITMVVVQLAMGQFSPRIVQRILRDKPSQLAIGLFVATFVHAVLTTARWWTEEMAPAGSPASPWPRRTCSC